VRGLLVALALVGLGAVLYLRFGKTLSDDELFPHYSGVFTRCGVFIGMTRGALPIVMDRSCRVLLTVAGALAGFVVLGRLFIWAWQGLRASPILLFTAAELPVLLLTPTTQDRYFLLIIPGALFLAGLTLNGGVFSRAFAALGILAAALFSVALMHDCFAWNSARWEVGRRALENRIDPAEIEGGFEWDGWYSQGANVSDRPGPPRGLIMPYTRLTFPNVSGRYALSFSPIGGTVIRDREGYTLWLHPGQQEFLLVEQDN
jgi:hypothetical protein